MGSCAVFSSLPYTESLQQKQERLSRLENRSATAELQGLPPSQQAGVRVEHVAYHGWVN
jgi:hypothetical protein